MNCAGKCQRHWKRYMQCLVMQQVLVGSAGLWGILLKCCENLFGKSTNVLLVAVGEICSMQFPSEGWIIAAFTLLTLWKISCLKTLISGKQRSLEQVKRIIEESLSTIWSLKTFKAIDNLVARVLQGAWWGLDFEFCERNPKSESGKFYGWQTCDLETFPRGTLVNMNIFLSAHLFPSVRKSMLTSLF